MLFAGIFLLLGIGSFLLSPSEETHYDVTVQTLEYAGDGLDLQAVGGLIKKTEDGEHLEKLINSKEEGINNLDLNEDGKVDYISVTEYGTDQVKGFSLTVEPAAGETQEVATIEIEKLDAEQAQMEVKGNEHVYGRNHYYHGRFGITDMLLMAYLFRPHPFYMSPWGYGYHPGGYAPYSTAPTQNYRSQMNRANRSSVIKQTSASKLNTNITSPNSGKSANSIRAPLRNPTSSQKSFQKRNPSQQLRRGGFGRSSQAGRARSGGFGSSSRPSQPSVRRSGYGRSGGAFGGK